MIGCIIVVEHNVLAFTYQLNCDHLHLPVALLLPHTFAGFCFSSQSVGVFSLGLHARCAHYLPGVQGRMCMWDQYATNPESP